MRKFAIFLHKSSSGMLIARLLDKPPKTGLRVINSQGRVVGIVADIIGPVKNPYVVIKPYSDSTELSSFEELYIR